MKKNYNLVGIWATLVQLHFDLRNESSPFSLLQVSLG